MTLNFSRGASHVIAQYFQLLRLGRDGCGRAGACVQDTHLYLLRAWHRQALFAQLCMLDPLASLPIQYAHICLHVHT